MTRIVKLNDNVVHSVIIFLILLHFAAVLLMTWISDKKIKHAR